MKVIILEVILPFLSYIFYFVFDDDSLVKTIGVMIFVASFVLWLKFGLKVNNSLQYLSYLGVVIVLIWWGIASYVSKEDVIEPIPPTETSDVPMSSPMPVLQDEEKQQKPIKIEKPKNTETNKYDKLMEQGIWYDKTTGLYWDRCSVGQAWDGETCQGEPLKLNWQDAQDYVTKFTNEKAKGGYTDWRVPTIEELASIRYCSNGWRIVQTGEWVETVLTEQGLIGVVTVPTNNNQEIQLPIWCGLNSKSPALDKNLFFSRSKYLGNSIYWTSLASVDFKFSAWTVEFDGGEITTYNKYGDFYVRAVRSD